MSARTFSIKDVRSFVDNNPQLSDASSIIKKARDVVAEDGSTICGFAAFEIFGELSVANDFFSWLSSQKKR